MIQNIYNKLSNNQLNEAFELIISSEKEFSTNSTYWCLRGDLCCLINEFETAINCYEKSLSLDILNTMPIYRLIELYKGFGNTELINHYKNNLDIVQKSLNTKTLQFILEDLNINKTPENLAFINNKIDLSNKNFYYLKDDYFISNECRIHISYFFDIDNSFSKNSNILIPLNEHYITNVNKLLNYGVNKFSVVLLHYGQIYITEIDKKTIDEFKKNNRDNTIVFHQLNESDSNVFALYNNIPDIYKNKFKRILLKGTEDYTIENMAKIPLLASISVSGHELFLSYPCPQLMHNIEVGHGSMPIKACGALDKMPNFAFSTNTYKNVDTLCITSQTDLLLWRSFTEISPNKTLISGNPRTDTLLKSNGRKNLEKILELKLDNKKVIFNMPTFHTHENSGRVNGDSSLNDFIKIPNFNYKEFDSFLEKNNCICILKVHHAEQSLISNKNKLNNFKNIYAISNLDLKKYNLDLYEVLNSGDLLITDYSSVYADFLFMNKPIVFTNYDINEYRNNRGIALEPYDFWTAGPKVKDQNSLQIELLKSLTDETYYLNKRTELKSVFFKYDDANSSHRIWEHINSISNKKL